MVLEEPHCAAFSPSYCHSEFIQILILNPDVLVFIWGMGMIKFHLLFCLYEIAFCVLLAFHQQPVSC